MLTCWYSRGSDVSDRVGYQNWATRVDLVLGGWFVFVDQAAEHGSAFGPCCWGIGARVIRPWRLEVERAVRAPAIVVAL